MKIHLCFYLRFDHTLQYISENHFIIYRLLMFGCVSISINDVVFLLFVVAFTVTLFFRSFAVSSRFCKWFRVPSDLHSLYFRTFRLLFFIGKSIDLYSPSVSMFVGLVPLHLYGFPFLSSVEKRLVFFLRSFASAGRLLLFSTVCHCFRPVCYLDFLSIESAMFLSVVLFRSS